jgi:hypothetical protein
MKNFPHFSSKIFYDFSIKNVLVKKIAILTFFIDAYIFSDRRLKNLKIFIFHLLSTFFRNIIPKSGPKNFIISFLNSA